MKENKELDFLCRKVGFTGTLVSSVLLASCIPQINQVPKITLGVLSVSLITSNMLLVRDRKNRKIKKEKQKIKKVKRG